MFGEYLLLEFFLLSAAGFTLLWNDKGIILSWGVLTAINLLHNYPYEFWYWEIIISLMALTGIALNYLLNKKTHHFRVLKVSTASAVSLLASGLVLPLFPAFLFWSFFLAVPLLFTYRTIPRAVYLQIIFKFIFSMGWIIIGNILY